MYFELLCILTLRLYVDLGYPQIFRLFFYFLFLQYLTHILIPLKLFEEICIKMFDIEDMKYYEVLDTKYKIDIMSQFFD